MTRLHSLNLDALKRPVILISLAAVVLLAAVWWFAWMTPEASKLSSVNAQIQSKTLQLNALRATLAASQHDAALLRQDGSYLRRFSAAVPPGPEAQVLTTQLFQLAARTVGATHLNQLTDDSTIPPATGQVLSRIPISISIDGPHNECLAFLNGLYKLSRLITVSAITPAPKASSSSGPDNVLAVNAQPYTMTISATAYYSPNLG